MRKKNKETFVKESTFKTFAKTVFTKSMFTDYMTNQFHPTVKRLDNKIDKVALALLKTQDDVAHIKENMATKQDIGVILDRIDAFTGQSRVMDQEQMVQGLHIKELKETARQHETRISALEK